MMIVAYIPPLWRKVMDKRVLAHYEGDLTRANIQPSKREKLLARYPAPGAAGAAGHAADTATATLPQPEAPATRVSPTGEYVCPNCGHHYSEAAGEPREGFPAGTPWSAIPDDWQCPDCGVRDKVDFLPVS